jgi:predicted transcriptional regulator
VSDVLPAEVECRMSPAKERLIRLIEDQPDDSSVEEILRELAFAAMVERGVADSDAGRTISNDEMARRIQSWRRQSGRRKRSAGF